MIGIEETRDASQTAASPRLRNENPPARFLFWRRHSCGCRILAIKLVNESPGDVQRIRCVNQWYLTTIDYYIDVMGLCIRFQGLTDVFLQGRKDLRAFFVIGSLGIFALTLKIFLQLIQLFLFQGDSLGISYRCGFGNVVSKRLNFSLQRL